VYWPIVKCHYEPRTATVVQSAETKTTAAKASLENKHLGNDEYFAFFVLYCWPSMMPMGALLNMEKENFTLLCNVVVKTLNLEISR